MRTLKFIRGAAAAAFVTLIAACGGGGGGSTTSSSSTTSSAAPTAAIASYLVDGPAKGLSYACNPSGLNGQTDAAGTFTCQSGDVVTFTLNAGNGTINLGKMSTPGTSGVSVPVTMLPNGLQVAEILQALNHGTITDIDVTGLTLPATVIAAINSYIASGGTLPSGQNSDDQFLAYIQGQTTGTTSFVVHVTGTGKTFLENTVLPNLQTTIAAISATNPPPVVTNNVTTLNGTILVSGSGTLPASSGCTAATWSASGGGILNAVINGNIQTPGIYAANFSSPGFIETISISSMTCTSGSIVTTVPSQTTSTTVPPFAGNGNISVTSSFVGATLTMPNNNYVPPAGCTGGNVVAGTDVGLSNPLITLSTSVSCSVAGSAFTVGATAKLVGAF